MIGKTKTTYLIGSLIICLVAILAVFIGLTAGGVVDLFTTSVTFRTEGATFEYDGTAKTLEQWAISRGGLKKGHTARVEFTGIQTDVGVSGNTISVAILDKDGKDVTSDYNISYDIGDIEVTKRVLTIESVSVEKEYDGKVLECDEFVVTEGSVAPKQNIVAKITGSIDDLGECKNTIEAKVMANGIDVTANYDFKVKAGTLAIKKRKLVVQTADAQKVYDGTPLSSNEYTIKEGSLLEGHSLKVNSKTSITNIGIVDNIADVKLDTGSVDLRSKYDFVVEYGKLKVAIAEITVKTASKTKFYDGKPLVCEEYEIEKGSLKDGHTMTLHFANNAVLAGSYDNEAEFLIVDKNGKNITELYIINTNFGVLKIDPLEVTFSNEDEKKEYDATPLVGKEETCKLVEGKLLDGHTFTFKMLGSQTNVGTSENKFAAYIFDSYGTNVTASYVVNYKFGTLEVTKAPLLLKTGSAVKAYDGKPLFATTVQAEAIRERGGLKGKDYVDVDSMQFVSQTDVGSIDNIVAGVVIRNANGEDVTQNYDITSVWGKLTVVKAEIEVRAGSKTKFDDGTTLTCDTFKVYPADGIAEGEMIFVTIEGQQTGVGKSNNVVTSVKITDSNGNDKTFNYNITTKDGTLSVTGERPIVPSLNTGGGTGGGGLDDLDDLDGLNVVVMRVKSDVGGRVYLRLMSYGDYSGKWKSATEYGRTLDGEYGYAYLTGSALKDNGIPIANIEIDNYSRDYLLPYYLAIENGGYEVQGNETKFSGDTGEAYSALYYVFDYIKDKDKLVGRKSYIGAERDYYSFVRDKYVTVPSSTLAYMNQVISDNNFSASDPDVIKKVASFVQAAAKYNLKYNKALDNEQDVAVAFLRDYKEGVCRHYATAATMIYRALGFPARYTIGYVCDANAGKWTDVDSQKAHAWTEVYIEGVGWVAVEVTGGDSAGGSGGGSGGGAGAGLGEGKSISITPVDYIREFGYESIAIDATEIKKVKGFEKFEGRYTYEVLCSGKLTAPGIGKSKIESFIIFDEFGNDVTSEFKIKYNDGKMQLYLYQVTVTTSDAAKIYDGTDLVCEECNVEGLEIGHTYTISVTGAQKNVGTHVNNADVKIFDEEGKDITQMYRFTNKYGTLKVSERTLTIKSGSATKKYDGTPLVCEEYEFLEGSDGIADGQTIVVNIVGKQTNPGKSANLIENVTICDQDGKDVTSNYSIQYEYGQLKVTRK